MANAPKAPVDEKQIKASLQELAKQVDYLMPHLNKAQTAFGGLDEHVSTLSALKAQIAKALTIYGG